jgi:hypothetical protein
MSYKVFIAYAGEDDTSAQYIHDSLTRIVQLQPYKAEFYLEYGEDFKQRIQNELHESHFMIVLLTDNGRSSQWVNQEIGFAFALKRRLMPRYAGLPHIIPVSQKNVELKGLITKDSIDILFMENFPSFEYVMANIILAIRRHIPRGLEEGFLKTRITCSNCLDPSGLSFEYEALIPSSETIRRTIESREKPFLGYQCPKCQTENVVDSRTFFPCSQIGS